VVVGQLKGEGEIGHEDMVLPAVTLVKASSLIHAYDDSRSSPRATVCAHQRMSPRCSEEGIVNIRTTRNIVLVAAMSVAAGIALTAVGAAGPPDGPTLTNLPTANTRSDGYAPAGRLSPGLTQQVVAQGSTVVENPSALTSTYGYDNDVVNSAGQPQMVPTPTANNEAHKTEPDKNTYLVFPNSLTGADSAYHYGTHFLFQGHEGGASGAGYITRVNLDADVAHRVTVLATLDKDGNPITTIDGSTWDPWAQELLFTTESAGAPTYAATPGYPSTVTDVSGALGRGGYEGIQLDSDGNIWIVEDIGGSTKKDANNTTTTAKRPNSFVYRYVPASPGDLAHGKLQVLQATNPSTNQPITFDSQAALNATDEMALYAYGNTFATKWITIHDTAVDGNAPFNANTAAKTAGGTPFKRPENGAFTPGGKFQQFFFTVTGDTNATSPENDTAGGWGGLLKLTQSSPSASTGQLSLFYKGDAAHSGLDNIAFLGGGELAAVEDAGDGLHGQRNALDSGYAWDITADYSHGQSPVRWLAEGRDASATIDAANSGFGKNDGDNEITGLFVSNGDISAAGVLGTHKPDLKSNGQQTWRWFYTQQHGDNFTYEVSLH